MLIKKYSHPSLVYSIQKEKVIQMYYIGIIILSLAYVKPKLKQFYKSLRVVKLKQICKLNANYK